MPIETKDSTKNIEIEALRCFAVAIVIMGHSHNLMPWHPELMTTRIGFWSGVDVFLCISGFVITRAFTSRIRIARSFGAKLWIREAFRFFVRRSFRLGPAALFWLGMTFLASNFFNRSGAFGSPSQNYQDAVAIVFMSANVYFAACTTGWINGCGPNAIYWTVSLEQQFYLVFPALILLRDRTILVLCLATLLFFALVPRNVWIWYNRIDTLAIGIVIGLLSQCRLYEDVLEPIVLGIRRVLRWSGEGTIAIVLLSSLLVVPAVLYQLEFGAIVPVIVTNVCGAIILLASYDKGYLLPYNAATRFAAFIGERSFSIYLTHNLAMAATTEIFLLLLPHGVKAHASFDVPMVAMAITCLAVASELSFRYIEVPFRKFAQRKFSARPRAPLYPAL